MALVGYWPLNESSGDAVDYAGGANGTLNGSPTQGVTGILNNTAYDFDGSSDYVHLGSDDVVGGETQATVAIWVNLDSTSGQNRLFANDDVSSWQLMLSDSGDAFRTRWHSGSSWYQVVGPATTTGDWYHVVATFDAGVFELFVNGESYGTNDTGSSNVRDNGQAPRIASGNSGGGSIQYPMDGQACEARIYNRALTAAEVRYLYEASKQAKFTSSRKVYGASTPASPSPTYPLTIQNFNSSLSNWNGDTAYLSQSTTAYEGTYSMNADGNNKRVYAMSGFDNSFQFGDIFSAWFRGDLGESAYDGFHLYWGMDTAGDYSSAYNTRIRTGQIAINSPDGTLLSDSSYSNLYSANTWYRVDIRWATNGDIKIWFKNTDGTTIKSWSTNDSNYTSNNTGTGLGLRMGGGGQEWYDHFRIIGSETR